MSGYQDIDFQKARDILDREADSVLLDVRDEYPPMLVLNLYEAHFHVLSRYQPEKGRRAPNLLFLWR